MHSSCGKRGGGWKGKREAGVILENESDVANTIVEGAKAGCGP
jgi:hypothetical protein